MVVSLSKIKTKKVSVFSFQCHRLRLKGFGVASSVYRFRFASEGIFNRF
jgi:hypothetical protein